MKTIDAKLQALELQIAKLKENHSKVLKARNRNANTVQRAPTGLVTLVLRDEETKKSIHSFPDLDHEEFVNLRRVFYRVLVKKLGKDVKFKRVVQYSESA